MDTDRLYHIGFGRTELAGRQPRVVLLSGDPNRSAHIASSKLKNVKVLSEHRGLNSYLGDLENGIPVICATSGMGGPSTSIVMNELAQVGLQTVIRIGTTGSIQPHVHPGSVIITSAALRRQGATLDVAPVEFPAVADPFLTVHLAVTASEMNVKYHVGITASVDTFFEGQERTASSANPVLLRRLQGITEEYRALGILNYEMESATVFTLASVYGMRAACICAVIAQRTQSEQIVASAQDEAIEAAIGVAVQAVSTWP